MIPRIATQTLRKLARGYPIVAITGPRQSGKTTLARGTFPRKVYVSLEDPDERGLAEHDPRGFLARFPDGAILDEAQRAPALFSYLQTRVDEIRKPGMFVLTGSQQFGLLAGITQTLAGRVGLVQLLPFSIAELKRARLLSGNLNDILLKGSYPPIHDRRIEPHGWLANYVMTYVERDVRQVAEIRNLSLFQRFLKMCAARCGQLLNLSSLANDCGITHVTARAWMSVLEAGYIVHLLVPHHANFGKRLVKTPKLYFYDTGLAAYLLGIRDAKHLAIHPARGALFEALVIGEWMKGRYNSGLPANCYFWRDNVGNEIDLVIEQGENMQPIEIKSGATLAGDYFVSLRRWLDYAGSRGTHPLLVYGGARAVQRDGVEVVPWSALSSFVS